MVVLLLLLGFATLSALLPNLLRPSDLERLQGQLDLRPHLLPWPYFGLRHTSVFEQFETGVLPYVGLAIGLHAWLRHPDRRARLGSVLLPLAFCLFPFWRADVLDAGYRFSLMAPAFAALSLVASVTPKLNPNPSDEPTKQTSWSRWILPAMAVLLSPVSRTGFDPQVTPPYAHYRKLIEAMSRPLPELLIAHTGINFFYDHLTGHEALAWAPEADLDRTKIMRLAWGIRVGEWLAYAPEREDVPRPKVLDGEYTLVREDVWEQFVAAASAEDNDDLQARIRSWHNPLKLRPSSLRRR